MSFINLKTGRAFHNSTLRSHQLRRHQAYHHHGVREILGPPPLFISCEQPPHHPPATCQMWEEHHKPARPTALVGEGDRHHLGLHELQDCSVPPPNVEVQREGASNPNPLDPDRLTATPNLSRSPPHSAKDRQRPARITAVEDGANRCW
jgi:hypothetical protein